MRKILFKALDKYNNKWVEGFYAPCPNNKHYIIQDGCNIDINPTTLCQYTGLKDSCGNKIFENDLIKLTSISDMVFVITWNQDECCFEVGPPTSDTCFPLNDLVVEETVILRNKFDVR